ncbi:hypothetical protein Tco_0793863 [Tanacetum coccineum]
MPRISSDQLADILHDVMMETLPSLVKEKVTEQVKKEVLVQVRDQVPVYLAEGLILERKTTKEETERLISKAILQERGGMHAQISSQIQNAIDNDIPSLVDASVRSYMSGYILHVHLAQVQSSSVPEQQHQLYLAMKVDPLLQQQDIAIWLALQMNFEKTQVPQTACRYSAVLIRDQGDPHDDAHLEGEISAKGRRHRSNQEQDDEFDFWTDSYTSDDDEISTKQESRKEILISPHLRKITPLVQSCQRDPEATALSLINQDLFVLEDKEIRSCEDHFVPDYANIGLLWSLSVFIRSSVIWERVYDFLLRIESYQQKINLTTPTITFPGIEEYDVFSIVYEPVM